MGCFKELQGTLWVFMNSVTCKSLAYWESNFITPTIGIYDDLCTSKTQYFMGGSARTFHSDRKHSVASTTGENWVEQGKKTGIPWKNHAIFIHFYQP